jgi:hypothetical protein
MVLGLRKLRWCRAGGVARAAIAPAGCAARQAETVPTGAVIRPRVERGSSLGASERERAAAADGRWPGLRDCGVALASGQGIRFGCGEER